MQRNLHNRIHKILSSIRNEGLLHYLRRIIWLGRYRHLLFRLIRRRRLNRDAVQVYGADLKLPTGRREGIAEELLLYGVHEPAATAHYGAFFAQE